MNLRLGVKNLLYLFKKNLISSSSALLIFYLRFLWKPKNQLEKILDNLFKIKPDSYVLQVGANDGFVHDPLYKFVKKYKLKGIVVEPQKYPYKILKKIYHKDKISVVNAAIDILDGQKEIYKLSFTNDRWASGLSSFSKDHIESCISSGLVEKKAKKYKIKLPENKSDWITEETVKTICFATLFKNEKVEKINLLVSDTEGYDYEILKMFDFEKYKPELVLFEKTHLNKADYQECIGKLSDLGYTLYEDKANAIAIFKNMIEYNV